MTAPDVGWPPAAGDDETWRAATSPGGAARPERGVAGSRQGGNRQSGGRTDPAAAPRQAVSVLADRLAAALVHHEPGWRLPRHSALARRYNVSTAEIDAAVDDLVGRHLVRRLADGQLYRASPAEYVIGLEGVPGLTTYVDTMGSPFSCRSRQVTWRLPPEDIAWALAMPTEQQVCMVRFLWTAGGEPAAVCTTYVPGDLASRANMGAAQGLPTTLNLLQVTTVADIPALPATDGEPRPLAGTATSRPLFGTPSALHIEQQAPPPSVARSLRLTAGQPALMVTVRFADPDSERPVALTIAVLRPDMFRLIVQTPRPPLPATEAGGSPASWAHTAEGWET
jgi:DNA-binding GntR family transcriptional regulator